MNNDYNIVFDGISASDVGITLLSPLQLSPPMPRSKRYSVPGRNGDVHIYDGAFENRTATVKGCVYDAVNAKDKLAAVNKWLFTNLGYRKLVSPDDPDHYIMARVTNGAEVYAKAKRAATFTIKFDCKPQRFIGSSAHELTSAGGTFESLTSFPSKPLIRIDYNSSKGVDTTLTVNGVELRFNLLSVANYSTVYYDAESGSTYYMNGDKSVPVVGVARTDGEIEVIPGENTISTDGKKIIQNISIDDRGWDL